MRPNRFLLLPSLILSTTLLFLPMIALADDTDGDDYDVKARVVRVSLIHGEAAYKRHDTEDWESARLNTPLVEGDTVSTGADGRLEIQIDARNFVRLASDSVLRIVTLRDEGIALSLVEGTATLRLARFDRDQEWFEIDAPKTTIAAESKGLYRISAGRKGTVQLTVRDGGRARVYSDTAGFTVKDGRTATLTFEGDEAGEWQTAYAGTRDGWDDWVHEREQYLASRFNYDQHMRYYDADIWGAEDLDAYGSWTYANDYGWIWRPSLLVVNNYSNWTPYRYGRWTWCAPYGWTWVGDEPWGWAPYHYGRWVYYDNYWAWSPHSYYRSHRNWWRPALVAFISLDFSFGSSYCWYPLPYRQRDPRSTYFHQERLRPLRADELASLRRINPAYLRALNTLPARDFGRGRGQPAGSDLARRVLDAQQLRGDLPLRPTGGAGERNESRGVRPASALALRPTGATLRPPGVPLDNELRRSRIFNGREPVGTPVGNAGRSFENRPTGAVARPARPANVPSNPNSELRRNQDGPINWPPAANSPGRPRIGDRPVDRKEVDHNPPAREEGERPTSPSGGGSPGRPIRPSGDRPVDRKEVDHNPPASEERERPPRSYSPARPERIERPSRDESPVRPERNGDGERPAAPARSTVPRSEPPQRHEPPPRAEPPQRRESPPPRSAPAPHDEPARPHKPSEDRPPI